MRKDIPEIGEYYHLYNRGVEKRDIFLDDTYYRRFIYLLHGCNDQKPLVNSQFYYRGLTSIVGEKEDQREKIVDIIGFCLMPNHFHILAKQIAENGVSLFMQKLLTGYTMYFNKKCERSGSLFQGSYKSKHINEDKYLYHLSRYIHLNPLEFKEPNWKESNIKNIDSAFQFCQQYPWSSLGDYTGQERYRNILSSDTIKELFLSKKNNYPGFIKNWLVKDIDIVHNLTIEV